MLMIVILPLFYGVSCYKETPPKPVTPPPCDTCLPAVTTSGKNTFGCRVNGKVWLPKAGSFNPGQWVEYFDKALTIHGYNEDKEEAVDIAFGAVLDTGMYVATNTALKNRWGRFVTDGFSKYFWADTMRVGYMHVLRFELTSGFMAGTFAFDAYTHQGDTVHITDGRFDLHL
jgi:hypothetical protein